MDVGRNSLVVSYSINLFPLISHQYVGKSITFLISPDSERERERERGGGERGGGGVCELHSTSELWGN